MGVYHELISVFVSDMGLALVWIGLVTERLGSRVGMNLTVCCI